MPIPKWVNTRKLDAETVMLIAQDITPNLWTKQPRDRSIQDFYDFTLECVRAFQIIHAKTNWPEHGDYWGTTEAFCETIKGLLVKDQEMVHMTAEEIAACVQTKSQSTT